MTDGDMRATFAWKCAFLGCELDAEWIDHKRRIDPHNPNLALYAHTTTEKL